jgi:hypothetical protein
MSKTKLTKVQQQAGALRTSPVRLSKEELAGSRTGTLGCFPSPELYEPEDDVIETSFASRFKFRKPHAEIRL